MRHGLRSTLRQLLRQPTHTSVAVLSLAIGLAVSLATFSALQATILAPKIGIKVPFDLLRVRHAGDARLVTGDEFARLEQDPAGAFASIAAEASRPLPALLPSGAATVPVSFVSATYFGTLGTTAVIGRVLGRSDDAGTTVMISERLWRREFSSAPNAIGRSLTVAGHTVGIVGVTPDQMPGLALVDTTSDADRPQIWLAVRLAPSRDRRSTQSCRWLVGSRPVEVGNIAGCCARVGGGR